MKIISNKGSLKNKFVDYSYLLIIGYAIITFVLNIWQANKGLVMNDEGWYLFLLKDLPTGVATSFHLLFKNVFAGNIYAIRLSVVFLNFVSTLVYASGLYLFFKDNLKFNLKSLVLLWALSFMSLFGSLILCLNYVNLNQFLLLTTTGFLLISTVCKNKRTTTIFILLSGLLLGFLPFIMITNVPVILLALILVFLIGRDDSKIKNSFTFIIGILMSVFIYFTFFDSIIDYANNIIHLFTKAKASSGEFSGSHGLTPMIFWIISTLRYLVTEVFVGVLFLYGLDRLVFVKNNIKWTKLLTIFGSVLFTLFYVKYVFLNSPLGISPSTPFLVIFLYAFIKSLTRLPKVFKNKELYVVSFIILIPLFLSLGTNVDFKVRIIAYLCFFLPLIYIFIHYIKGTKSYYIIFFVVISFYFAYNLINYTRTNWGEVIYTEQKYNIKELDIDQNLFLDETKYNLLIELKGQIKEGDDIIIGDQNLWGYMYLINAKPITYTFKFSANQTLEKLNGFNANGNVLKCITTNLKPFDAKFLNDVKETIDADTVIVNDFSFGKIYTIK